MYLSVYIFFSLQCLPLFPSFMNWRQFFGYASLFFKTLLTLDVQFMFVKIHFHNALKLYSIWWAELYVKWTQFFFSKWSQAYMAHSLARICEIKGE